MSWRKTNHFLEPQIKAKNDVELARNGGILDRTPGVAVFLCWKWLVIEVTIRTASTVGNESNLGRISRARDREREGERGRKREKDCDSGWSGVYST